MTVHATLNVNNHRKAGYQLGLIDEAVEQGAAILVLQELTFGLTYPGFFVVQGVRKDGSAMGEAVMVHESIPVLRSGWEVASPAGNFGVKIRDRSFPWATVLADEGRETVFSVHMPKRNENPALEAAYQRTLARTVGNRSRYFLGGDMNDRPENALDQMHLRRPPALVAGKRIDLWFAGPKAPAVKRSWESEKRPDDHVTVLMKTTKGRG